MGKRASSSLANTSILPLFPTLPTRILVLQAAVLFVCIHPAHGKELVHGTVSIPTVDPSLPSADQEPFPSSFFLNVTLGGRRVHLRLHKDRTVQPYLPVFALSTDREGIPQAQRARLGKADYAVFSDAEKEATFGVYREKDNYEASVYTMEGVVHSSGTVYALRSTGRTRRRHRRDVPGSDETADVDSDNNKEEGEGGKGEEKEFEVDILSDGPVAYDSDSLPKPFSLEHTRVKQDMARAITVSATPLPPSPLSPPSPPSPPAQRKKRQVSKDVFIDVVVVADHGVYKTWLGRSTQSTSAAKQQDALQNIRRYYAFIMNGVTMLYKSITTLPYSINVRLTGIVVSTMAASSTWTEQFRVSRPKRDLVDANQSLYAIQDWAKASDLLPAYDHLMVFTGYDLSINKKGVVSDALAGLAFTGTVCDTNGEAVSVVEDFGVFECIGAAAHELGHGLSALHDGNQNTCRLEDRYVMAPGAFPASEANKLNPWKFSSCSVTYFNTFVTSKVTSARGKQCLYGTVTVKSDVPDVTSLMEGQVYNADDQCRLAYGSKSSFCRVPGFVAADVCLAMSCNDPDPDLGRCYQRVAARGTSCGNQKWCQNGLCVSSGAAPSVPESCLFGDQPGSVFDNQDCKAYVDGYPGYCYDTYVRAQCCSSCARHYKLVQGCEYGDKGGVCSLPECSGASPQYLSECCGTCNHGNPLTSTSTTTLPPPTGTTSLAPPPVTKLLSTVSVCLCVLFVRLSVSLATRRAPCDRV